MRKGQYILYSPSGVKNKKVELQILYYYYKEYTKLNFILHFINLYIVQTFSNEHLLSK